MADVDPEVRKLIDSVENPVRRRDAETLVELMSRATGQPARIAYSGIVGFGTYHYHYESGRQGDAPGAGFAPRKPATTIYLNDGVAAHADELEHLGPHTTGVGCLYVKDLEQVDLDALERVVRSSYEALTRPVVE
ncbi:DUF1801 domain-containing protein [Agromyces sp. NPDC057865]|uniref:DUF1801 domain-containing protein n=1 Tax=Agromyces sp. NPDC057865 TaxID=3346267 RepID=UPI003671CEA2